MAIQSLNINPTLTPTETPVKTMLTDNGPNIGIPTPNKENSLEADMEKASNQGKFGYDVLGNKISPTVISSNTPAEKYIPENQKDLNTYSQIGTQTGADGYERTLDGKVASAPASSIRQEDGTYVWNGKRYATSEVASEDESLANLQRQKESMLAGLDAQTQRQVEAIQNQFVVLRKQQEAVNQAQEKGRMKGLLMSGTARYAQTGGEDIMGAQISAGIQSIASLNAQEQSLIAQARTANEESKFKLMDSIMNDVRKTREEKVKVAKDINDKLAEANKKAQEKFYQTSRDYAIADLFSQGVTSPTQMIDYLNFDENGKQVGDFTAEEIDKTMKSLALENKSSVDKLTGDVKNFAVLKTIPGMLPKSITSLPEDQQLNAYLKWDAAIKKSATAQTAGNTGAGTFDQFSKEQIALSVIPTQLRNSDTELKRYLEGIRLGLSQGLTPYEIADNLMGYKIEKPDDFSNGIRQYMAVANLGSSEIQNVARLVNSGNKAEAISVIENKVMNTQKTLDPDGYVGESTARYYAEKVAEIRKTIEDAGLMDSIGPIEGSLETVLGKLKSREASKIQSKVTNLVAEMRNHLSGTAVTDSEKKFLEPLVASLSDKKGIFINKIEEIKSNALTRLNQVRGSAQLSELNEEQLLDRNKRTSLYGASSLSSQSNDVDNQIKAKSKVKEVYPKYQSQIDSVIKANPTISDDELLQVLGIEI